jgi:2-polyprenyl-3-methyl-5-hydroxy-6-metoxy-1,4-benzoquinol methylase
MLNQEMGAAQVAPKRRLYRAPDCDLTLTYQHPDATAPLTVPVHLVCNTPDEILIANIKANSALKREWIAQIPAHDGVAVICGSGPSLADDLGAIDELHSKGGTIFAMNGAASFLAGKGFWADYQVIADAREQTASLIGPARHHIFASQVDPSLFEKTPDAKVLQVNFYEDHTEFLKLIESVGPVDFALIGSHGSVGNVSLALVYAMGFRNIHVFGFDSSFRDEAGHAFSQPMNVTEPVCQVEYAGKQYQCTFTMKSQADVFPRLAYELEQMGARFTVHGSGFLQDRWNGERAKTLEQREADKYRLMWDQPSYYDLIPALEHVEPAVTALGIQRGDKLIDFGCGSGRAAKALVDKGIDVIGIDIADNAPDEAIVFVHGCLWDIPSLRQLTGAKWGFCVDVMEHIPTEKVDDVLAGIAFHVKCGVYFAIDSVPDRQGLIIGQPLHLTVREPAWWLKTLREHFYFVHMHPGGVFVCFHKKQT